MQSWAQGVIWHVACNDYSAILIGATQQNLTSCDETADADITHNTTDVCTHWCRYSVAAVLTLCLQGMLPFLCAVTVN